MTGPDDHLALPIGQPGSGRARYGAAMALFRQGRLTAEALEVYRICALLDHRDPAPMLAELAQPSTSPAAADPQARIRTLVEAADTYLATLPGPGVAEVRQGLNRWRHGPVTPVHNPANPVVGAQLPAALAALHPTHPALAAAIQAASPDLNWITYDLYGPEIGEPFIKGHAYASLIGENAAIPAQDYDLGLFLIAPHVLYRDHRHAATELYAPLTGPHGWRFGPDRPLAIKPAHVPIWNDPNRPHLTKVGPIPFLAFFGWTRDVQAPAQVIPAGDWPVLEALRLA